MLSCIGPKLGAVAATLVVVSLPAVLPSSATASPTVWLCRPDARPDPCAPGFSTAIYTPSLRKLRVEHPRPVKHPAIDCFYVYPTVSGQKTPNANLHIDAEERLVAQAQAGRYSQYCRVFAPMYRQVTLLGLNLGDSPTAQPPNIALPLADLREAFAIYLRKYNNGRGFILIGHSQGSYMLRRLIAEDVDPKPAIRQRLVSAVLLGGNVLVKRGRDIGGDFKYIQACRSRTQLHCVIAFSMFDQPVAADSLFGRPWPILGTKAPRGDEVLCTDPATLSGDRGLLDPIFPDGGLIQLGATPLPGASTPWSTAPRAYRARCSSAHHAHVLQIVPVPGAPMAPQPLGPKWGLHLIEANIALGNLIRIVKTEAGAYAAR